MKRRRPPRGGPPWSVREEPSDGEPGTSLGRDDEVSAPVLLPAGFRGLGAEGALLSVRDRAQARGVDAEGDEVLLGGVGAAVAEREVIGRGSAFVAVALDQDLHRR